MLRKAGAPGLVCVVCVVCLATVALVGGQDFLNSNLAFGVPVGNAIAVSGLVALGLLTTMISHRLPLFFSRIALALAIAWYPLSVMIAGNPRLNFTGDGSRLWLLLTGTTLALLLSAVLLGGCQQLYRRFSRRD